MSCCASNVSYLSVMCSCVGLIPIHSAQSTWRAASLLQVNTHYLYRKGARGIDGQYADPLLSVTWWTTTWLKGPAFIPWLRCVNPQEKHARSRLKLPA